MRKHICFIAIIIVGLFSSTTSARDMVTYAGAAEANVQFFKTYKLSDGTYLITGQTNRDLSWTGQSPSVLDTTHTKLYNPLTEKGYSAKTKGFILHLANNKKDLLHVVTFPEGLAENIYKIRTTNPQGDPTGTIYISGKATSSDTTWKGYYIAKLNNNFVEGIPGKIEWFRFVRARNVENFGKCYDMRESHHRKTQPWDVDNKGRVVFVNHREYSHGKWVKIRRMKADGSMDAMPQMFYHEFYVAYDSIPHNGIDEQHVTKFSDYKPLEDSAEVEAHYRSSKGTDSAAIVTLKVDSIAESYYQLKHSGTTGRSIRSLEAYKLDSVHPDENGNNRYGLLPYDVLFSKDYDPNKQPTSTGHFGQSVMVGNMRTARVGDIVIDKRTNMTYFSIDYAVNDNNYQPYQYPDFPCPNLNGIHFECAVIAMDTKGAIDWWAKGYRNESHISEASQFIDNLDINYAEDKLMVLGRGYGKSENGNNFWKGNNIALNPGGNGFKNELTGSVTKTEYSWLGKYSLDTALIHAATYIAEYDSGFAPAGTPLSDPLLDNWPDPNEGDPDIGKTVCHDLKTDDKGNVYVACESERVITTGNAYQTMIKPDKDTTVIDSIAPSKNAFIRQYTSDLSTITYSSLLTGKWNHATGMEGNNTSVNGILPDGENIWVTGMHAGRGADISTYFIPSWGNASYTKGSAILASLDTREKLAITSYTKNMGLGKTYNVSFSVPESVHFSDSNTFLILMSGIEQTFNNATVIGKQKGNSSGTMNISLKKEITAGFHKMMLMATEDSLYSRPVEVSIIDELCAYNHGMPQGDTSICAGDTTTYTVNDLCVPVAQWMVSPSSAKIDIKRVNDTTAKVYWSNSSVQKATIYAYTIGLNDQKNDTTIYSDTLSAQLYNPEVHVVADTSTHTLTATPNGTGYTFQWYNQNKLKIQGATNNVYEADYCSGDIQNYVMMTTPRGCKARSDLIKAYDTPPNCADIDQIGSNDFVRIYPNPAEKYIHIQFDNNVTEALDIILYDLLGNVIYKKNLPNQIHNSINVPLSNISSGMCILELKSRSFDIRRKMMIR